MQHNPAIEAYKNTSFEAAPPLKILRMLYAGAIRFMEQAEELDPVADGPRFNDRVSRADAIVAELRCSLDPNHSKELAEELDRLYVFVEGQLNTAVLEQSTAPIEGAKRVLSTLKEAWDQLEVNTSGGDVAQAG